jgi:serine/threonine-protein kinase
VVFFELISGRRPFEDESVTAIQMAHLSSEPPSLLSLDPNLPSGCDAMVQKLLSKQREDRYQNTAEPLSDLAAHGARQGPGALRPKFDPRISQAIENAELMPLDQQTGPPALATRTELRVSAPPVASAAATISTVEPNSGGAAQPSLIREKTSNPLVEVVIVCGLVLLLGGIGFVAWRSLHTGAADQAAAHPKAETALPLCTPTLMAGWPW